MFKDDKRSYKNNRERYTLLDLSPKINKTRRTGDKCYDKTFEKEGCKVKVVVNGMSRTTKTFKKQSGIMFYLEKMFS